SRIGGTNPPSPPAAPTKPVIEPTRAGSERWAMSAKVAPEARPKPADMAMNSEVETMNAKGWNDRAMAQLAMIEEATPRGLTAQRRSERPPAVGLAEA